METKLKNRAQKFEHTLIYCVFIDVETKNDAKKRHKYCFVVICKLYTIPIDHHYMMIPDIHDIWLYYKNTLLLLHMAAS